MWGLDQVLYLFIFVHSIQFVGDWFLVARLTGHFADVSSGRVHVDKIDEDNYEIHYRAAV